MAQKNDSLMEDESFIFSESADWPVNYSIKNGYHGNKGNHSNRQDSLSDEKMECDEISVSASNSHQEELQPDSEGISNEVENAFSKEIPQTAVETLRNRIDYLDDKCMRCSEFLNDYFQRVYNELKKASIAKNWRRLKKLYKLLKGSEPYYNPLLRIVQNLDEIRDNVKRHEDCLNEGVINNMMRTCTKLEGIVNFIASKVPET